MTDRFVVMSRDDAVAQGICEEGYDDEYRSVLVDTDASPPTEVFSDGGEPEDMILCRDLSAFVEALNRVASEHERAVDALDSIIEWAEAARADDTITHDAYNQLFDLAADGIPSVPSTEKVTP